MSFGIEEGHVMFQIRREMGTDAEKFMNEGRLLRTFKSDDVSIVF